MTEIILAPDLNADLLALTQHPEQWADARAKLLASGGWLQGFQQQIGSEHPSTYTPKPQWVIDIGENYYPRLRDGGFFSGLKALGVPFAIETPGFKAWDMESGKPETAIGQQCAFALTQAAERVRAAGGTLDSYTFDDPRTAALIDVSPPLPLDQLVIALVNVVKAGQLAGVRAFGLTDAYPRCTAAQIIELCERMQQAGYGFQHVYLDFDLQHALQLYPDEKQIADDLKWLQAQCRAWTQGSAVVKFGIIVNGQRADDPQGYHDEALKFLQRVKGWLGGYPDRIVLESWKKKNLPYNLPDDDKLSHAGLLLEVAALVPFPEIQSLT